MTALRDLQHELARTHRVRLRRRRTLGAAAVALPVLAVTVSIWQVIGGTGFPGGTGFQPVSPAPIASADTPSQPLPSGERSDRAQREPGEESPTLLITPMSDEELLAALAEVGQPSGLVRVNGETFVVANAVPHADVTHLMGFEAHP